MELEPALLLFKSKLHHEPQPLSLSRARSSNQTPQVSDLLSWVSYRLKTLWNLSQRPLLPSVKEPPFQCVAVQQFLLRRYRIFLYDGPYVTKGARIYTDSLAP